MNVMTLLMSDDEFCQVLAICARYARDMDNEKIMYNSAQEAQRVAKTAALHA